MFERGKVVLVPFPFTDLSSQKIRPAVILSKDNHLSRDVVVVFISSVVAKKPHQYSYVIEAGDKNFKQAGLKVPSVVVCDKLATLDKTIIIGEIGSVPTNTMKELSQLVKVALGL